MSYEGNETILFVDDEESILEVVGEFFQHKGYNVITAGSGEEAVDIIEAESIDCCISDINMPGMSGLELAEYIREKDMSIPVVIMTGFPSLDNTIKTLKNGVVDFLIKPVNLEQMAVCIKRVFRERKLFVENLLLSREVESKKRIEALNNELVGKVEELNNFNKIMSEMATTTSSADLFRNIVDLGLQITKADEASFYIINSEDGKPYEVISGRRALEQAENSIEGDTINITLKGRYGDTPMHRLILEIVQDEIPLLVSRCNGIRELPETIYSLMIVPLKIRDKVFGVIASLTDDSRVSFGEKDLYYLSFMTQKAASTVENIALYENIYENLVATLSAFVKAVEVRDEYTKEHSQRVAHYSVVLGKELGCSKEELDILDFAGRLHDIGKIGIRDNILLKPGRLTEEEFSAIKEHPEIGAHIVGKLGFWNRETEIIKHHHERYDGTGYPEGLKGEEIPLLARIMSVADAYDAMASDRAYRQKMPLEKVNSIIKEGSGFQFDSKVVTAYFNALAKGLIP